MGSGASRRWYPKTRAPTRRTADPQARAIDPRPSRRPNRRRSRSRRARASRAAGRWCRATRRPLWWGSTDWRRTRRKARPAGARGAPRAAAVRVDHVLNRDRAYRAVELRVAERESWVTIHVVNDVAPELWVVRHLLRVQTQSHDGARAEAGRKMAAPTAHQIEQPATGRQNLRVQL